MVFRRSVKLKNCTSSSRFRIYNKSNIKTSSRENTFATSKRVTAVKMLKRMKINAIIDNLVRVYVSKTNTFSWICT